MAISVAQFLGKKRQTDQGFSATRPTPITAKKTSVSNLDFTKQFIGKKINPTLGLKKIKNRLKSH